MFGYRPWEIARLTDLQIEKLIIEPEVKRAEKAKKSPEESGPGFEDTLPAKDLESIPPEEVFVNDWHKRFGETKEYWRAQYRANYGGKNADQ